MTITLSGVDAIAADLRALIGNEEHGPVCPVRDVVGDVLSGRTFTLPRGVTFTTADRPIYWELKYGYEHGTRRDVRDHLNGYVYGTVTRNGADANGTVNVFHYLPSGAERAYYSSSIGAPVPDGARANIAAAVLDAVRAGVGGAWGALADEVAASKHAAAVRGDIGTALRALDDAALKLKRGVTS